MNKLKFLFIVFFLMMTTHLDVFAQQTNVEKVPKGREKDETYYGAYVNCAGDSSAINAKLAQVTDLGTRGVILSGFGEKLLSFAASETFSLVGTGVSAIGKAIKGHKSDWQAAFEKENHFTQPISTLKEIGDFYSTTSTRGALDPSNMKFNGFRCIEMRGNDTVLYMSCHLDTTANGLDNIVKHSKFGLTIDTLVFFPFRCDIPNNNRPFSQKRSTFSFDERCDLMLGIEITMKSSWINQAVQVYNDVELGKFKMELPIKPEKMNIPSDSLARLNTACRFVRGNKNNYVDTLDMVGDCFIVPRSYMGISDSNNNIHDSWGTGQYKFSIVISETCNINPEFVNSKQWKKDWKKMKKQSKANTNFKQYIRQKWDEKGSQWVVSLINVPVDYSKELFSSKFGINVNSNNNNSGPSETIGK